MIGKGVWKFCNGDVSKIENYNDALLTDLLVGIVITEEKYYQMAVLLQKMN